MIQKVNIIRAATIREITNPRLCVATIFNAETSRPRIHIFNSTAQLDKRTIKLLTDAIKRQHTISNGQPFNVYSHEIGYAFEATWF